MKRFLTAAILALVLCALDSPAFAVQGRNVRVGPSSDDFPADASSPSPKSEKKSTSASSAETKPLVKIEKSIDTKQASKADAGESARADVKSDSGKNTVALSNNPATVAPVSTPRAASDAPPKSASDTVVPLLASSKSDAKAVIPVSESDTAAPAASTSTPVASPMATAPPVTATAATTATALAPTAIYRVGVGDVLDIRLLNQATTRESTLYTIMAGGLLDYPLAGEPVRAGGMTPDELGAHLAAALKRRAVYEKPQVVVSVRDYSSHTVLVSGLVGDPGTKILRREAVPLYVIIAEAQPLPDAGRALIISRATGESTTVDLSDTSALAALVHAGDVVQVQARPKEFLYIGGEIALPGQKDFHSGLTLTQAVLASGGVTRFAGGKIKVARQGADGRLVSTEYNLKEIEAGKVPDPRLQPGDRIEVARKN